MAKTSEITPTPASVLVDMTKALPVIPNGARSVVYEQVIPNANERADASYGKPDPAHND